MRCQLSEEYLFKKHSQKAKMMKRKGTIVRFDTKRGVYSVVWDGLKTAEGYHKDFIKIIQ